MYSCARCFAQAIAFKHRAQISDQTTVAPRVFGANFKKSYSYVERFDANLKQQQSCARCLEPVLAF